MSRLYRGCVISALVGLAVTVLVMVQLGFRNRTSYTKAFALAEHTHKVLEALRGVRIEIDHVEAGLRAGLVVKAREDAERSRSVALKMTLLTADHPSQHALAQRVVGAADALSLTIVARPETVAGHVERIRRERIAQHHGIVVGLPDHEVREIEFRVRHASGTWRWLRGRELVFRRDASGRAVHLLGAAEDITERRGNEAALIKAKAAAEAAARAKGQFLANMSHEIRTPINGVVGLADLALATPLTSESRTYVEGIRSSADSLLAVVNDILDFSKVEAGKLAIEHIPFDIHKLVGELVAVFAMKAKERGIDLAGRVSPCIPSRLAGDPNRLRQILINLIGNALKFTQAGSIRVRIEAAPDCDEDAGFVDLQIAVEDTGVGIPANRMQAIFEPFEQADGSMTRRFGGTGLGLAITTKLVELMRGSIAVTSVLGEGSTFRVSLRLENEAAPPTATHDAALPTPAPLDALRVLLVEDNHVNQVVAGKMLERMGHAVTIASDGLKALEAWRATEFDLILMDVQMPVMDGFEAIFVLRDEEHARARHTRVIALTAHAMQGDRELCLSSGFDGYLTKPIHFASLAKAIADVREFSGFQPPPAIL